jgi:hypothetical protein
MKTVALLIFCLTGTILFVVATSHAQDILYQPEPDSPIGVRNTAAAPGTAQYDFLIGDWDVEVTLNRPGQDPLTYTAKWHNHWVANGFMVMQEWRGPYTTGVEIRSYDDAENVWHGRNIYFPSPGIWYDNTARFVDSEMIVTTHRSIIDGGESITREIYYDISNTGFRIRTELSVDGGAIWSEGRYSAIARIVSPPE